MKLRKLRSTVSCKKKKKEKQSKALPKAATRRVRRKRALISHLESLQAPTSTKMIICSNKSLMSKLQNIFSSKINNNQMNTMRKMMSRNKIQRRTKSKMAWRLSRRNKRKRKRSCSWMSMSSMRMRSRCLLPTCRRNTKRIPIHSSSSRKNSKSLPNK